MGYFYAIAAKGHLVAVLAFFTSVLYLAVGIKQVQVLQHLNLHLATPDFR
jgi:hypothetical protein